ncbi:MAG: hypothetical protein K8I00_06795, partial [Candidatus Omnitrophica bacterium]|nr:hypothetical protein [Candidatus Omnitrophota bacterium]
LYGAYHVPFAELNKAFHELTAPDAAAQKALRRALAQDTNIPLAGEVLAAQRVKNSFESYLSYKNMQQEKLSAKFKEMSMEYALSQIFPAKQKELFKKRLNREKMTKTEREYYYRVVKKKAQALANPELHRMAQKIMDL